MRISWLGHACFLLETKQNTKVVTDPYEPGSYSGAVGYSPVGIDPDVVTISHYHFDHGYTKEFRAAVVIDKAGEFKVKDLEIKGIASYHDKEKGAARGENIIFLIKADGINIAHFGDLGTLELDYDRLKDIDIALIPVGGTFTIDSKEATDLVKKINPKIVVPMHFKTSKLGFDIDSVEEFLLNKPNVERDLEYIEFRKENLPSSTKIVVLKFLR